MENLEDDPVLAVVGQTYKEKEEAVERAYEDVLDLRDRWVRASDKAAEAAQERDRLEKAYVLADEKRAEAAKARDLARAALDRLAADRGLYNGF